LQFVAHEEGRARWAYHKYTTGTTAYKFEYDFFERDHQGNTRTVLTQERDTTNYIATMESTYRASEEQLFGNIATTCVAWTSMPNESTNIPNNIRFAYTSPNDSVSKVDSSSAGGQKVGPNLLLKVMSGDSVNLSVQCYYTTPGGGTTNYSSFSDVLTSLGQGLVNLTGAAHGNLTNLTNSGSSVYTGLSSFLSSDDTAHTGYPKAYINWIFLDDQFNYVSSLSGSVLAASSTYPGNQMNLVAPGSPLALSRNGYLYIWVSNETCGWDVFFDNLSVQYKQGPLLEENHYYPYGLTMAGISDKAVKTQYAENKYRYDGGAELQNKEFSDGSGLELYETSFRSFDPQVGRFFQIDPLADQYHSLTTYQYAGDNPVLTNDPTGANLPRGVTHGQSGDNPTEEVQAVDESYGEEDSGNEPFYGGGGGGGSGGGGSDGGAALISKCDDGLTIFTQNADGDWVATTNISDPTVGSFQGNSGVWVNSTTEADDGLADLYNPYFDDAEQGQRNTDTYNHQFIAANPLASDWSFNNSGFGLSETGMFGGIPGIGYSPPTRFVTTDQISTPKIRLPFFNATTFVGTTKEIGDGISTGFATFEGKKMVSIGSGVSVDNVGSLSLNVDLENFGLFIDIGIGPWDITPGFSLKGGFSLGHSYTSDDGTITGANYSLPLFYTPAGSPVPQGSPVPVYVP